MEGQESNFHNTTVSEYQFQNRSNKQMNLLTINPMNNLKKMTVAIALCFITSLTFSQTDSIHVVQNTDAMSGETYVYPSRDFVCANETRTKGFKVTPVLKENLLFEWIAVTMVGIGGCNENDEMIILFENGEKIIKKSAQKFNCKGNAYFNLSDSDVKLLKSQPMSKIRMTNGRTYESYTGDVTDKNKRYFIQLFNAIENKIIIQRTN